MTDVVIAVVVMAVLVRLMYWLVDRAWKRS